MKKVGLLSWSVAGIILLFLNPSSAAVFQEGFSSDPVQTGWRTFGDASAFHWNATNGSVDVTWDSAKPTGYLYHNLGTTLAIDDTFSLEFDLRLSDAQATGFFQLAIGLFNLADATNSSFSRATAASPNLFEFDYYPDGGFGPSIDATLADSTVTATNTSHFYFAYDNLPLDPETAYHIVLNHAAGAHDVAGMVFTPGAVYTTLPNSFPGRITDFRLDTVSISSYTSRDDPYGDSILAHGSVDNIIVTLPPPPITIATGGFDGAVWQVQFASRTNWAYALQRTSDFVTWNEITPATTGTGAVLSLTDTNPPLGDAGYRVRATRP